MTYTVADGIVVLSTRFTWIKLSVMVPRLCAQAAKVAEYYKTVSGGINRIMDKKHPGK